MRTKWEYNYIWVPASYHERAVLGLLNEAGDNGWEFTGHVETSLSNRSFLMRRERSRTTRRDE